MVGMGHSSYNGHIMLFFIERYERISSERVNWMQPIAAAIPVNFSDSTNIFYLSHVIGLSLRYRFQDPASDWMYATISTFSIDDYI